MCCICCNIVNYGIIIILLFYMVCLSCVFVNYGIDIVIKNKF